MPSVPSAMQTKQTTECTDRNKKIKLNIRGKMSTTEAAKPGNNSAITSTISDCSVYINNAKLTFKYIEI
jgi:hypothetical protein